MITLDNKDFRVTLLGEVLEGLNTHNLTYLTFIDCKFINCNFTNTIIQYCKFSNCEFRNNRSSPSPKIKDSEFVNCNLEGIYVDRVENTDFTYCNFSSHNMNIKTLSLTLWYVYKKGYVDRQPMSNQHNTVDNKYPFPVVSNTLTTRSGSSAIVEGVLYASHKTAIPLNDLKDRAEDLDELVDYLIENYLLKPFDRSRAEWVNEVKTFLLPYCQNLYKT
jgi:hypothetical protein